MKIHDETLMAGVNARLATRKSETRWKWFSGWRQDIKSFAWWVVGMSTLVCLRPFVEVGLGMDFRLVIGVISLAWAVLVRFNDLQKTIQQLEQRVNILEESKQVDIGLNNFEK